MNSGITTSDRSGGGQFAIMARTVDLHFVQPTDIAVAGRFEA
ncbi:hypothetical protein [Chamaesiphon sp. GL140_3_metabinner_50]|nr:hypothetical protein [Chamaesiphon sp. GL140_3_metabinner_50]